MTLISRQLEWDSAHRVLRHESKCSSLHGHRYRAHIMVEAEELDEVDRVVDFGVVKGLVGTWVDDHWDHTALLNKEDTSLVQFCQMDHQNCGKRAPFLFDGEPTAEVIAAKLFDVASELLKDERIFVARVRVWETPNCWAEVEAE